jgi:NitT/TauT family transport system substrate-binding protein
MRPAFAKSPCEVPTGRTVTPRGTKALGITRRAVLDGALASTVIALSACKRSAGEAGVLRIGLVASVSHGPVLAGLAAGTLAAAVAPLTLDARLFRAGPRVVEALVGNAIDVGITGPAPVVLTHARHAEGTLRVLSGCASGGASLVVGRASGVRSAHELRGRSVAVTQLGSTQDIALRTYLRKNGLTLKERGGDVTIHAFGGATVKQQMASGELAAAWVPEPWGTRLVQEIGAIRLVDERDLWPERSFASALVVAHGQFVAARAGDTMHLVNAIQLEIDAARANVARLEQLAFDEIARRVGSAGPRRAFHDSLAFVDFTTDPMPSSVQQFADDAAELGFVHKVSCAALF